MAAVIQERKVLPKPTSFEEEFCDRFIRAADLKGKQVTLRIAAVDKEELDVDDAKAKKTGKKTEVKITLSFHKTPKQLVLNRTNGECLKKMFGNQMQGWVGKYVTLYAVPFSSSLFPDVSECLRVWGSPDIAADIAFGLKLPRKRMQEVTLHKVAIKADAPREPGQEG